MLVMVAVIVATVVIVALAVMLQRLQRQVREMAAELAALRSEPAAPQPAEQAPVAVITELASDAQPTAQQVTTGRVVSVTLADPLIKVAALVAGLRRALDEEHRMQASYAFRRELKRQRKLRRRAAAARTRQSAGWVP